ncbi:hypothetical protein LZ30DRAFT_766492 [Colletotrichum cereale]|nr:hypothetical protein LZ30DRAFT_766492 [Colletotrichum cereale]
MTGKAELAQVVLQGNADVNAKIGSFLRGAEDASGYVPTPGGADTALRIALDTGRYYGRFGHSLDEWRLVITSMLVELVACVEGVADHFEVHNVADFGEFPELWGKLRAGITVEDLRGLLSVNSVVLGDPIILGIHADLIDQA